MMFLKLHSRMVTQMLVRITDMDLSYVIWYIVDGTFSLLITDKVVAIASDFLLNDVADLIY